jgi:hypothetical protein
MFAFIALVYHFIFLQFQFHTGNILWRGHFTATGSESGGTFTALVQGGGAFSVSLYLDGQQLAYYPGTYNVAAVNLTGKIPVLEAGSKHVFTILQVFIA